MRAALAVALFAVASVGLAAPPALDLPAEVRPANGYARLTPKTDAVGVVYVALDGVYPFPSEELKNPKAFVLPVAGLKDGRYRFVAVAAGKGGEQAQGEFVVVVGKGDTEPPPKIDPIPNPMPKTLYFLIVRADGPASPAFTKAMGLPEWATLRAAGHKVKDMTQTAAKQWANVVSSDLPAVVTLEVSEKASTIVRAPVPLPTTGAGVLDLPKGVR